ncbi:TolC family protein [Chitinibacter sp. SCUT-21]|uniref:TolC family protein n=1 Tax=Chitinibacter sp. SCUT-21 TaxID=2970891 RepID=UPI0035A704EB
MRLNRFYTPILCGVFIALPVHAASMKDVFELATQLDAPLYAAQRTKAEMALSNAQALTPEPMSLTLSGTNSLNDNLAPTQDSREYEAELGIPLWQWGQKERLLSQVKQAAQVEQQQLFLERWELAGKVREAVWAARLAQLEQRSAEQKKAALEQIANDLARQLKAGEVAPLDVNLAQQALLQAEQELALSRQLASETVQQFQSLLGADSELPQHAEVIPSQLEATHPQLLALQAQAELARAHLAQAQYDTRETPELAISLTRERGSPDEEYKHLGKLSLRIPFGSDGRTQARVSSANVELLSAQTQAQRLEKQIRMQQFAAQQALTQAQQALKFAEQNGQLAAQAWQWQQRSYRAGQTNLQAFLNAQRDFLDRGFAVQRAELELGRATSHYLQTLGVLP